MPLEARESMVVNNRRYYGVGALQKGRKNTRFITPAMSSEVLTKTPARRMMGKR